MSTLSTTSQSVGYWQPQETDFSQTSGVKSNFRLYSFVVRELPGRIAGDDSEEAEQARLFAEFVDEDITLAKVGLEEYWNTLVDEEKE